MLGIHSKWSRSLGRLCRFDPDIQYLESKPMAITGSREKKCYHFLKFSHKQV